MTDPREQVEKKEDSKISKMQPKTQPKKRSQRPKLLSTDVRAEDISENIVGSRKRARMCSQKALC